MTAVESRFPITGEFDTNIIGFSPINEPILDAAAVTATEEDDVCFEMTEGHVAALQALLQKTEATSQPQVVPEKPARSRGGLAIGGLLVATTLATYGTVARGDTLSSAWEAVTTSFVDNLESEQESITHHEVIDDQPITPTQPNATSSLPPEAQEQDRAPKQDTVDTTTEQKQAPFEAGETLGFYCTDKRDLASCFNLPKN
jgi:hypothetical protein